MPYYKAIVRQLPDGKQVVEQVIFEPLEMDSRLPFEVWGIKTKPAKKIRK